MKIEHTIVNSYGQFKALDEHNRQIGVMTYIRSGMNKISIDHTEVNPAFEGRGIGHKLVDEAVRYARQNHLKILPLCWFVELILKRKPEFRDVLA
jgi:uncharacterized protein